ncbi:MAG: magnesium transporter CorA family protein [Gemmatimonadaceae bacterium]|nr:magnesium transporter CorA family protein [Gemmatimonadaceae bacterium]
MGKRRVSKSLRLRETEQTTPVVQESKPRSWHRGPAGEVRRDLDPREFAAIVHAGDGVLWVDIDLRSTPQHALLEKVFKFHPLSIEDTLSPDGRVKFEEFPGYALAVVRAVRFVHETEDLYDIEMFNLWVFVGKNYVVTVHGQHAPGVEATHERLQRATDLLERGPSRLMHHILDATVDAYFPVIDQLDEFVDGLEERVFVQFEQEALRDIFSVKRLVLQLKRHLSPMREVFNTLQSRPCGFIPADSQLYFRDVYDHVIRLNESLDTYRDLLSSTMDSYLTQVSNRMGRVTKGLTVVATLSVPFVVVSGMWGMNFQDVPLSGWPHGFWVMLAVQLGLGGLLLWVLQRRGWM